MFYDKQLGPLMEKSLLNLRNELERAGVSMGVWECGVWKYGSVRSVEDWYKFGSGNISEMLLNH